ncbi:hypothetical protein [Vibrio caribbeanicus]|uniref:hypothetical protein n=1 Tax=Vibrio caribbeanicus TaxID=701175 RepID=UPI0030DD844E
MYQEPWCDITEFPISHAESLVCELTVELSGQNVEWIESGIKLLAKREDQDEILIATEDKFYIVHLTWSGKLEHAPYPKISSYDSWEQVLVRLSSDSEHY